MTNVPREYFSSIINTDEYGGRFWIYVEVPENMLDSEVTEDELNQLKPEKCYLNDVNNWPKKAIDKLDILLSLPDPDALTSEDRLEFETALLKLQ
jgi:hypothetical protein